MRITAILPALLANLVAGRALAQDQNDLHGKTPVPDGWYRSADTGGSREWAEAWLGSGARFCDMTGTRDLSRPLAACWSDFAVQGDWTKPGSEGDWQCPKDGDIRFMMHPHWGFQNAPACVNACSPCMDLAIKSGYATATCKFHRHAADCELTYSEDPKP